MLNKLNLQKKLLLGLTIIIAIVIVILSSAFYYYLSSDTISNEYYTSQRITERTSTQIDELYKQMDMSALFIVKNEAIHSVLSGMNSHKSISDYDMIKYRGKAKDQLKILSYNFPNITGTVIFDVKRSFYFRDGLVDDQDVVTKRLSDISWYKNLVPAGKQLSFLPPHQDFWVSISRPVISVIRKLVFSQSEDLGLFEIDIPYWNLQNICDTNTVSDKSKILIFDDKGTLLYPNKYDDSYDSLLKYLNPKEVYTKISKSTDNAGQFKISGNSVLFTSHKSNYTNWNVVLINEQTALHKAMNTYRLFISLTGTIILLTVFAAFFILIRGLTRPLKQLCVTMESVSLDNMDLKITNNGQDEIKLLNESFEAMFSKLKNSINDVYESKIRETNSNLLALQAQMNPHFLYNTLSIISASSEKFGNIETANLCNKLSHIMRYIVSPVNSTVTLIDELNNSLNYLDLMKSHYEDYRNNYESFLNFKIEIPEEMNSIILPKMTFQPIIENCINHGFDKKLPPWDIIIRGSYSDNENWIISIEDNGSGFEDCTLKQLNIRINEYYSNLRSGNFKDNLEIGGMGILNTYARLAINFKDSIVFKIENKPECGSVITFGRKNLPKEIISNDKSNNS